MCAIHHISSVNGELPTATNVVRVVNSTFPLVCRNCFWMNPKLNKTVGSWGQPPIRLVLTSMTYPLKYATGRAYRMLQFSCATITIQQLGGSDSELGVSIFPIFRKRMGSRLELLRVSQPSSR